MAKLMAQLNDGSRGRERRVRAWAVLTLAASGRSDSRPCLRTRYTTRDQTTCARGEASGGMVYAVVAPLRRGDGSSAAGIAYVHAVVERTAAAQHGIVVASVAATRGREAVWT